MKRGDLNTPAGVDQDFNFLAGLERKFNEGDQLADRTGIDVYGDRIFDENKRQYRKRISLSRALRQSGVTVERAPMGMSRAKRNKTIYHTEKKCLEWTFEIIDINRKVRYCNALETVPLQVAAARVLPKAMFNPSSEVAVIPNTSGSAPDDKQSPFGDVHFYLQLVRTSCAETCLLPVDGGMAIASILKGRRIVEFPTFYVLHGSPEQLPEGFILEQTYKGRFAGSEARKAGDSVKREMDFGTGSSIVNANNRSMAANDLAVAAEAAMG